MIVPQETAHKAALRFAATALRDGFEFEALHTYTDAKGEPLYWRIRLKNSGTEQKWIRPMKYEGGRYLLGEPAREMFANGKPLYRLHELIAQPDEPVIVTEGELKADKLAALGLLVTTSGGADSAASADWKPLAGREVAIWPDNDDPGRRYAVDVMSALKPLGCVVGTLDVEALNLKEKEDAADWLAAHPDATAADVKALACVQESEEKANVLSESEAPTIYKYQYGAGSFKLTEEAVFFIGTDKDGNEKAPLWVCSRLTVIAKTRDAKSGEWGRLLEWHDDDGVLHRWAMPLELLESDGADLRRSLARLGLHIGPSQAARDLLAAYIKACPVEDRARCVERLGWYGDMYVTPTEVIGASSELVVFQNAHSIEPALKAVGTVEDWRDSVAVLAAGNTRLVFAICVALAGALAGIVGEDSGGFHLRGKSSSGKSTALKASASVWGDPGTFMRLWRATANGLEGLAALHNDNVLILDELSQCDPREAGEAAYMLANGQGKARATRNGTARAPQRWRLMFLSAGEESLSALMSRAGKRSNVGQEIRLADFDADAGAGMGVLETLHDHSSPAALVAALKEAAVQHHGTVGVAWLRALVQELDALPDLIAKAMQQFVAEVMPEKAVGQVERVARRFALVAAAGERATHYGLTGWKAGESTSAAKACFASWLESFGGVENREERAILSQVRAFFEAHGASRFEDMQATEDQRIINRAGFYRSSPNGTREFLVLQEAFKREVCAGIDAKAAEKLLIEKGWIVPGGDKRPTQKPRLPGIGTKVRVYVFGEKMWEERDE